MKNNNKLIAVILIVASWMQKLEAANEDFKIINSCFENINYVAMSSAKKNSKEMSVEQALNAILDRYSKMPVEETKRREMLLLAAQLIYALAAKTREMLEVNAKEAYTCSEQNNIAVKLDASIWGTVVFPLPAKSSINLGNISNLYPFFNSYQYRKTQYEDAFVLPSNENVNIGLSLIFKECKYFNILFSSLLEFKLPDFTDKIQLLEAELVGKFNEVWNAAKDDSKPNNKVFIKSQTAQDIINTTLGNDIKFFTLNDNNLKYFNKYMQTFAPYLFKFLAYQTFMPDGNFSLCVQNCTQSVDYSKRKAFETFLKDFNDDKDPYLTPFNLLLANLLRIKSLDANNKIYATAYGLDVKIDGNIIKKALTSFKLQDIKSNVECKTSLSAAPTAWSSGKIELQKVSSGPIPTNTDIASILVNKLGGGQPQISNSPKQGQVGKSLIEAKPAQANVSEDTLQSFYNIASLSVVGDPYYEENIAEPVFGILSDSKKRFFDNAKFYWYWNDGNMGVDAQTSYANLFFEKLPEDQKQLWGSGKSILMRLDEANLTDPKVAAKLKQEAEAKVKSESVAAKKTAQENSYQLVSLTVSLSTISKGGSNESEV